MKPEMMTAAERVSANSVMSLPVRPSVKPTATKTAVMVTEMMAKAISRLSLKAAAKGESPFSICP